MLIFTDAPEAWGDFSIVEIPPIVHDVGDGGFSFRSKRLIEAAAEQAPAIDSTSPT